MKEYRSDFRQLSPCFTLEYMLHLSLVMFIPSLSAVRGGDYSLYWIG